MKNEPTQATKKPLKADSPGGGKSLAGKERSMAADLLKAGYAWKKSAARSRPKQRRHRDVKFIRSEKNNAKAGKV